MTEQAFRRYEILLPRRFNNGQPIPKHLLRETVLELRDQFGAVSCETQSILGHWIHKKRKFQDERVRLVAFRGNPGYRKVLGESSPLT